MRDQTPEKFLGAETISRTFFVAIVVWAVHVARTPDPSQLLTCGAALHLLSLVSMLLAAGRAGLPEASCCAMLLLAASLALRLCSTTYFQGYLPVDSSGDGPYQVIEATALLLALKVVAYVEARGKTPLNWRPALSAATFSAMLAALCYGSLNKNPTFDRIYAMSIYVELCAVAFQAAHLVTLPAAQAPYGFLVPQVFGFLCRLRFWLAAYGEIAAKEPARFQDYFPECLVGSSLLGASLFGVLVLRRLLQRPGPRAVTVAALPEKIPGLPMPPGGCRKLVPVSAVYTDDGLLRVTYRPSAD